MRNRPQPGDHAACHARHDSRTAAEVLVDQLIANGVEHVFCVPGESFLGVLDAFHDRDITVTVCRQEGGAAMMAEAVGKATGRPGVCFVTRGPGATNASAGIHIAHQDSTPMIMFVGQVERDVRGREAFQELDYKAVFGSMTKLDAGDRRCRPRARTRRRAPSYAATSGRPGPVVVSLPKDMLNERIACARHRALSSPVETSPGANGDGGARGPARGRPSGRSSSWAARRWTAGGLRRRARASPSASTCRSPRATGARRCSTRCIPTMPATSASAPTRS